MLAKELVDHDNAFVKKQKQNQLPRRPRNPFVSGGGVAALRLRHLDPANAPMLPTPPASGHL